MKPLISATKFWYAFIAAMAAHILYSAMWSYSTIVNFMLGYIYPG